MGSFSFAIAGNWTPAITPFAGDDLVFPANSVTSFTPMNDFSAGSSFASMTISGSGYTISGNSIVLTGGLATSPVSGGNKRLRRRRVRSPTAG